MLLLLMLAAAACRAFAADAAGPSLAEAAAQEAEANRAARVQDEDRWTAEFNHRSFEWHLLSTKIIFMVVHGIVVFGLGLTYLQLSQNSARARRRVRAADAAAVTGASGAEPTPAASSLKIGPSGLEISSQIIGLLILAFSLGFFYLYITRVYPMVPLQSDGAPLVARANDAGASGAAAPGK